MGIVIIDGFESMTKLVTFEKNMKNMKDTKFPKEITTKYEHDNRLGEPLVFILGGKTGAHIVSPDVNITVKNNGNESIKMMVKKEEKSG